MDTDLLILNGINGATGEYLTPPLASKDISALAQGHSLDPLHLSELKAKYLGSSQGHYGAADGINPKNLAETGWGVIFASNTDPAIREALSELLNFRKAQATKNKETYYREYIGADAYQSGESKTDFLTRHGAGPGPANPENVPYYLLIVGDPNAIPYRFQYQLDVQYGVGRIYFTTTAEYAQYAHSVVAAETRVPSPDLPRAVFVGVLSPNDIATARSANQLVSPLADAVGKDQPNWKVEKIVGDGATKARMLTLMGGSGSPTLLFTASHGIAFPNGDPRQEQFQGALLCQDWPGPQAWQKALPADFYLAADDISPDAQLQGLIAVHFACYGLGTPQFDEYSQASGSPTPIAPEAFVANLPQRLLGHPKGGALAVIGHVDRAWSCGFLWPGVGREIEVFQSAMKRLMDGYPVGSATEYFNQRYAELASDLSSELEDIKFGKSPDDQKLAGMWTENNDARNYAVLGDPAVRLGRP